MRKPSPELIAYAKATIASFCQNDERLLDLMMFSLGRVLVKACVKSGDDEIAVVATSEMRHIRDWLKAAMVNGAPWLSKTDGMGRPRKLMKFSTVQDITREADRDMIRQAEKTGRQPDEEGDVEVHTPLSDGYSMVRLLTPAALDRETSVMQHCIGQGAYDARLADDRDLLLSLRDRHGNPHATIHVEDGVVEQISGKQNQMPVPKYWRYLTEFLTMNPAISVKYRSGVDGFVVDNDNNLFSFDALPAKLRMAGSLYLRPESHEGRKMHLPLVIEAADAVDIDTDIFEGPIDSIRCGGTLCFLGNGTPLPQTLSIGGLVLSGSDIEALPDGLRALSRLSLWETPNITSLPSDLRCSGDISLGKTGITEIPSQLLKNGGTSAPGALVLKHSLISSLGAIREVNGDLDIRNARISCLPDGLVIRGDLNIQGGELRRLDAGVLVERNVYASHCDIDLVGGTSAVRLCFDRSTIRFGKRFIANGLIKLASSVIERMPDEIECGGALILNGCTFPELPRRIRATSLMLTSLDVNHVSGSVSVESIAVLGGRRLTFGKSVKADIVHIHDPESQKTYTLPYAKAREYLRSPDEFGGIEALSRNGHFAQVRRPIGSPQTLSFRSSVGSGIDFNWQRAAWLDGLTTTRRGTRHA